MGSIMNEVYARFVEVAGTYFRYKDCLDFINSDDENLEFELEPTNKYDPNAIKVMWGRRHLGYVPAPLAKGIYMHNVEHRIIPVLIESYLDTTTGNKPKFRIVFDIILAETRKEVLEERDRGRDGA